MSLNRLADTTVPAVQLHGTLDLERRRVGGIARNTNENQPFLVSTAAVVDYLCTDEGCVPIEHLLRGGCRVGHSPMIDCGVRHDPDDIVRYPFPKDDVLSVRVRLDLGLGFDVEYL